MGMEVDWKALEEATSGAIGGLLSTTILYPLDTCKTIYQAEAASGSSRRYRSCGDVVREAWRERRLWALYQGLSTKNMQSVLAQFVYFYSYGWLKRQYLLLSGTRKLGTGANLLVAAAAGTCTALISQPLDTAATRMQTSKAGNAKGLWVTLLGGTWRDAYDGLGASLVLVSNPAIQYTVFEQMRDRLLNRERLKKSRTSDGHAPPAVLSAASAFLLGALSKTIATVCTYPAIRCKVMLQAERKAEDSQRQQVEERNQALDESQKRETLLEGHPRNMLHALRLIWYREGASGFYKGLQAQILKTVLSAALMLTIKEKASQLTWLLFLMLRRDVRAQRREIKLAPWASVSPPSVVLSNSRGPVLAPPSVALSNSRGPVLARPLAVVVHTGGTISSSVAL